MILRALKRRSRCGHVSRRRAITRPRGYLMLDKPGHSLSALVERLVSIGARESVKLIGVVRAPNLPLTG